MNAMQTRGLACVIRVLVVFFIVAVMERPSWGAKPEIDNRVQMARETYLKEVEKATSGAVAWFESQEASIRKMGNKKLLDQLSEERKQLTELRQAPKGVPVRLIKPYAVARQKFDAALAAAVKEYTQQKLDDEADAVDAELQMIRADASLILPVSKQDPFEEGSKWTGTLTLSIGNRVVIPCEFTMSKRSGCSFVATYEIKGLPQFGAHHIRTVNGLVSGHAVKWKAKSVKASLGGPGTDTIGSLSNGRLILKSTEGVIVLTRAS